MRVHVRPASAITFRILCAIATLMLFVAVPRTMRAQINPRLSYQGILRNASGNPVYDSCCYVLRFELYSATTGGTLVWGEYDTVATKNGLFSVVLGTHTPLDTLSFRGAYYLQVIAGTDTLRPRTQMVAVPYAFRARYVDSVGVVTADSARVSRRSDSSCHADTAAYARNAGALDSARAAHTADSSRVAGRADSAAGAHRASIADSARASERTGYADSSGVSARAGYADSARASGRTRYADSSGKTTYADSAGIARRTSRADSALFSGYTAFADSSRTAFYAEHSDSARKQLWQKGADGYVRLSPPNDSLAVLVGTKSPGSFKSTGRLNVKAADSDNAALQISGPANGTAAAYGLLGTHVATSGDARGVSIQSVTSTSASGTGSATAYEFGGVEAPGAAYGWYGQGVTSNNGSAAGLSLGSVVAFGSAASSAASAIDLIGSRSQNGPATGIGVGTVDGALTSTGFSVEIVKSATGAAYGLNLPNVTSSSGATSYGVYAENQTVGGTQYGVYGKVTNSSLGVGVAAEGSGAVASSALKILNGAVQVSAMANQTSGTTPVIGPPGIGVLMTVPVTNNLVVAGTRVIATVEAVNGPVPLGTACAVYVVSVSNINPAAGGFDLQLTRVPPGTAPAPTGGVRIHWWLVNP